MSTPTPAAEQVPLPDGRTRLDPEALASPPWQAAIEALLFVADRPLGAPELAAALSLAHDVQVLDAHVADAIRHYADTLATDATRAFAAVEVAGGWQLRTRPEHADTIHALYRRKPVRLSRAAMETLAIVAYRQPCTRAEIDEIRGVDSSSTLRQLLERDLLRILGKADDIGRPLLYGTTDTFLSFFGLRALADLPTLREFTELSEEHVVKLEAWDESARERAEAVADAVEAAQASAEAGVSAFIEEDSEAGTDGAEDSKG
ncbi:MAG: SMC-Scp complex subunit ScpB [Deltaproteobacteria bacterium]|nr:MAG: SMC-Scp complex subunit ScpB [Deltaproteobacteria bacterium]